MAVSLAVRAGLLAIFIVDSTVRACDSGWFGPDCQYMCHCTDNACDDLGQCQGNAACERGWFGPACQYRDMAVGDLESVSAGPGQVNVQVLFDGIDYTCIDIPQLEYISLSLTTSFHVKWLRFISDNPLNPQDFVVHYFPHINCTKSEHAFISDRILDNYCHVDLAVQQIVIKGRGIRNLCTIHISGGRNVAIKAKTYQSSTWKTAVSGRAVDGSTDGDFHGGKSCAGTLNTKNPFWEMEFLQPSTISRYIVFNRDDGVQGRLKGFNLRSKNIMEDTIFQHTDSTGKVQIIYTIVPETEINQVSSVRVSIESGYLGLCEVEVYGETECPPGTYGFTCNNICNCAVEEEACFVSTGTCPSGCASGFFGEGCALECPDERFGVDCKGKCPENCLSCIRTHDHCDLCVAGKRGNDCTEDCPSLMYGPNCEIRCSKFCAIDGSCNPRDGVCSHGCIAGYQGPKCLETCDNGKYGASCRYSCSENCIVNITTEPSICHHGAGTCLFGCQKGTYGDNCNSICSINCIVNASADVCHRENGKCLQGCFNNTNEPECISSAAGGRFGTSVGPIVGAVMGVLILVGVIVLVVLLWRRRRSRKGEGAPNIRDGESPKQLQLGARSYKGPTKDNRYSSTVESKDEIYDYMSMDNVSSPAIALSLSELDKYIKSNDEQVFQDQFKKLPENDKTKSLVGRRPENKGKNRYQDIVAYDHSRVTLARQKAVGEGAYINASLIRGYQGEMFIAAQGPSKRTVDDFILMLWGEEINIVVMLTNLVEDGKVQCELYWPDDETSFGDIRAKTESTQVFADYTIRKINLSQGDHCRVLTQFHFTSWPAKGVPTTPWSLVDFEQRVTAAKSSDKPIVVHCSAGVGRTGTFIALRNLVKDAEIKDKIDVFSAVADLRKDRPIMVQKLDQYIFLYKAALVAITCLDTTVTSGEITHRIENLEQKNQLGTINLEDEFERLRVAASISAENKRHNADNDEIRYKNSRTVRVRNRMTQLLTRDRASHEVKDNVAEAGTSINAVFVPSFTKQRHQILAQLPQPSTVSDFWRLVTENNVAVIVAFDLDTKNQDSPEEDYLPDDEVSKRIDNYELSSGPTTSSEYWDEQLITIAIGRKRRPVSGVMSSKQLGEHKVTHVKCKHSDFDQNKLLTLINKVRSCENSDTGVVLYMCRDGATHSGLMCVLKLLMDRLDNDNRLTVPLVVGAIKAIRPQVIPSLDQYRFRYQVLRRCNETRPDYVQFEDSAPYTDVYDDDYN